MAMAKISFTYHLPVPVGHARHPGTITDVPLWCGKAWTHGTKVTYSHERTTCKKCAKLDAVYREDLEHKRNMQLRETLRQIEAHG